MMHPYQQLGPRFFWSTAVAQKGLEAVADLWEPKFPVTRADEIVTFGSCFSQHFGRALRQRGFSWLITEKAPTHLSEESRKKFNYDVFSARTGNIYTTSLLQQWVSWAVGDKPASDEIWTSGDRYFDPFRPVVEPNEFASEDELVASRRHTIAAFGDAISKANLLVFTMGLTESWFNAVNGWEYPMCPGTVAGEFDGARHTFVNQDYAFIRENLARAIQQIRAVNPGINILLTVSPVPLVATMSGQHVLAATMGSKSILRAVAGSLACEMDAVDYFPSYEIISSPVSKGAFFEENLRTVSRAGVDQVMNCFFGALARKYGANEPASGGDPVANDERVAMSADVQDDEVACEEALLDAFAQKP